MTNGEGISELHESQHMCFVILPDISFFYFFRTFFTMDSQEFTSDDDFSPNLITSSQASSLLSPSPVIVNHPDWLVGNLETGATEVGLGSDPVTCLNSVIPRLKSLDGVSDVNFTSLVKLIGAKMSSEIKTEAHYYRSKRSREFDDNLFSNTAEEIIEKDFKINDLHSFFEAATQKSGRTPGPQRHKIACLQANFYESLLKGSNLNAVGPVSLMRSREVFQKVQSKQVMKLNMGGSYSFHQTDNNWCSMALPDTGKGPVISDNAQRGCSKFQHHAYGKLDRATPVYVCTHNIRAESLNDNDDNEIFMEPDVAPSENEFHALFRPVGEEFISVVKARIEKDEISGNKAVNAIIENWLNEVHKDAQVGGGITSFEKANDLLNYGRGCRKVVCQVCHAIYEYQLETKNICPNCRSNPTVYEDHEQGPYNEYKFKSKGPNSVIAQELEPFGINPNGKENLRKLHRELKSKFWQKYLSFPFYGDGLPSATYERMKSEAVDCTTHELTIPLHDVEMLGEHCKPECSLDWPLKDMYIMNGESHEEIMMNCTSLTMATHFGLMDFLTEMGRQTKKSQLQAIRTKRLHTLFELNYIFLKGTMMALMVPYVKQCITNKSHPTVGGLFNFVEKSDNLRYQARFRFVLTVSLPPFIKRIGVRLDIEEISSGATALFLPIVFATNHTYYRDLYHKRYLNGKFVDCQEELEPSEPDLAKFLGSSPPVTTPNLQKYKKKHPCENIKYGLYKEKYLRVTERSDVADRHQGGDFLQEEALGRVITFLKKGHIFSESSFTHAVRRCQVYQKSEREKGTSEKKSISRRPKYSLEVQAMAALILDENEEPFIKADLGEFHEDTLRLAEIGKENYESFFKMKILATPTGRIKLKPAFVLKKQYDEYSKIENKTKEEIRKEIVLMVNQISFEDENELKYFESKTRRTNTKKDELLEVYHELKTKLVLFSHLVEEENL